jgi:predicted  nucleic acid-binding Zn-ribbon protein
MILEVYDALKAAGAPEDKAQAAAPVLANADNRFDRIDHEIAAVKNDIGHLKEEMTEVRRDVREIRNDIGGLRTQDEKNFRLLFGALMTVAIGLSAMIGHGFKWF